MEGAADAWPLGLGSGRWVEVEDRTARRARGSENCQEGGRGREGCKKGEEESQKKVIYGCG